MTKRWLYVSITVAAAAVASSVRADGRADLSVQASSYRQKVRPGAWASSTVDLVNHGPDVAQDVVLTIIPDSHLQQVQAVGRGALSCSGDKTLIICRASSLDVQEQAGVNLTEVVPFDLIPLTTTFAVTSSTTDWEPSNDRLVKTIEVSADPDLSLVSSTPSFGNPLDPGQTLSAAFLLFNHSETVARDVVLLIDTTRVSFQEGNNGDFTCTRTRTGARCTTPTLDNTATRVLRFAVRADPGDEGGPFGINLSVGAHEPELYPDDNHWTLSGQVTRLLPVTSTADAGRGSLRQAILDSTAFCQIDLPCKIVFRLDEPLPAGGWYTIRPQSELPKVSASHLVLDAGSQTTFGGDTNPSGPEVELSGERLAGAGNGLVAGGGCYTEIRGLAITNFPQNGILATGDNPCNASLTIDGNTIGVSPDGLRAAPNERGISVNGRLGMLVHDNVIGGNLRSGIFIATGGYSTIENNRIGLTAGGSPMPNGASGIYVSADTSWTHMNANTIANHQDFGMAMAAEARTTFRKNILFGNRTYAIDRGLDYESADSDDDTRRVPNRPHLTVATYDAASGKTHLEGTLRMHCNPCDPSIDLFASDGLAPNGTPQAQRFAGEMTAVPSGSGSFALQLDLPGDLRGQLFTATVTRLPHFDGFSLSSPAVAPAQVYDPDVVYGSSELSPAIQAQ
jgi:hypothetical protein